MRANHVRWAGDRSLLLEFDTLEHAMSAHGHLVDDPVRGQLDAIAGARTVLLRLSGHTQALRAREELLRFEFDLRGRSGAGEILIDVAYDGPDLDDAAVALGMSPEALVAWHTSQEWMGAFPGFAGFTYCVAQNFPAQVPRRTSPRTAVPGGSVALAGEFSGVYPRRAPGGWQLIGRTDSEMWNVDRERPSLIQPWDTVRYRQVRPEAVTAGVHAGSVGTSTAKPAAPGERPVTSGDTLEVLATGLQSLIEDFGREGWARVGAGLSGVMDRQAARAANHAVGNETGAPVIENLLGGFRARALRTCVLSVTGAEVEITVTAEDAAPRRLRIGDPFPLLAGEVVELGAPVSGARSVIAIRGGIVAESMLGSVSTDTHIHLGPPPVSIGDTIRVGVADHTAVMPPVVTAQRSAAESASTAASALEPRTTVLRVVFGPRDFWFSEAEQQRLLDQRWIVSPDSNRIGIRFGLDTSDEAARPLERIESGELLSEGMAIGSLQVPPSGTPVLLMNDQGITGGYPIIAVVIAQDLSRAAQVAPGDGVRFTSVDAYTLTPVTDPGGQLT